MDVEALEEAVRAAEVQEQALSRPPPAVASDVLADTGAFSVLPLDLLAHVLQQLPLDMRLTLSISVCKGFRALRTAAPSLWTSIALCDRYTRYASVDWINGTGLLRLITWVPDIAAVRELRIHCSKGLACFQPADISRALASCPDVEELQVTGLAVVKSVFTSLAATLRPKLRELLLDNGTVGMPTMLKVLAAAPNVARFTTARLSGEFLSALSSQLRAARGGGTPLLTHLYQNDIHADKLSFSAGACIGEWFPELTDLGVGFPLQYHENHHQLTRWVTCPNLRRLNVHNMIGIVGDHLSSTTLGELVKIVVGACPRLEALSLIHGQKYVSRNEALPPLPLLGDALLGVEVPRSLVLLHLEDIIVGADDVSSCELPKLKLLRLLCCGSGAQAAADALLGSSPLLTREGCEVHAGLRTRVGVTAPDWSILSTRRQANIRQFPTRSVAGLSLAQIVDQLAAAGDPSFN